MIACVGADEANMSEEDTDMLDVMGGLALVEALLAVLGPYLSPYLEELLRIIFHPQVQRNHAHWHLVCHNDCIHRRFRCLRR